MRAYLNPTLSLGPDPNGPRDLLVSFYPPGPRFLPVGGPKSLQVLEVSVGDTQIGLGAPTKARIVLFPSWPFKRS